MKLQAFHKIPGSNDMERYNALLKEHRVLYIQPKVNGVSCHVSFCPDGSWIRMETKNGKAWNAHFFPEEFYASLRAMHKENVHDLILHGELAARDENMKLATFAGHVNVNSVACGLPYGEFVFYVYDVSRSNVAEPFSVRNKRLSRLQHEHPDRVIKYLSAQVTYKAQEIADYYKTVTRLGGEGLVIRCDPCYYFDGIRETPHGWKHPQYFTDEGTIIAVVEGLGKREGMLGSFVLRLDDGETILSVGGGEGVDDALLIKYWNDRNLLIRSRLTFRYSEKSRTGTPLRPQIVSVRNYE